MNKDLEKEFFYESFAEDFDRKMNMYDTEKRISVIFDELLNKEDIKGKKLLDAGCGTGWFSKRAMELGAETFSLDLGEKLLAEVQKKTNAQVIVGSVLAIPFEDNFFDLVISSEVIEHTQNPLKAIEEFSRVLKPGGILVVTTPNKNWHFAITLANLFKLRPYQGFENWVSFKEIKSAFIRNNLAIHDCYGIHMFPFVFPFLNPVLDFLHRYRKAFSRMMVNIAIKGSKQIET